MTDTGAFFATWGCLMLAYCIDSVLYGANMILIGQYFISEGKSRDSKYIVCTVAILAILATIQVVFFTHQIFISFVINFGNYDALVDIPFSACTYLLAIYLIAFTTQIFYATRVWLLSNHSIIFTVPIIALALLQIASGFAQTILVILDPGFAGLRHNTWKVNSTQSAAAATCDIAITAILCFVLHDSRTGIRKTNVIINKMIKYAVNRGAATSFCALLNLILFVAMPENFIFMVPLLPTGQLYVISVVSMLLARHDLRERLSEPFDTLNYTVPMSSIHITNHDGSMATNETSSHPTDTMRIHKQVVTWSDS